MSYSPKWRNQNDCDCDFPGLGGHIFFMTLFLPLPSPGRTVLDLFVLSEELKYKYNISGEMGTTD